MPWLTWDQLTTQQKIAVRSMRMRWKASEFKDFEFYIRKDGEVSRAKGSHRLTDTAAKRMIDEITNIAIYHPEKGDLHCWGPGHSFTFIRD